MDERLRFVARLFEGEKMAPLCAEFGISRRTGYKILDPYKDCGVTAFTDRSRRPYRQANRFAGPHRGHHCPLEARVSRVGRPQDPRETAAAGHGGAAAGDQHRPRRTGSLPSGEAAAAPATRRPGRHDAHAADRTECVVVRRLQGRVHARQPGLLLPADDHRLRQPLPADLRDAVHHAGEIRLHGVRPHASGVWAARDDSHR
jgi:hypothetical protein